MANLARPRTSSFTRPNDTTAYAIGDLVDGSTTAGLVVPMSFFGEGASQGTIMLRRCKLHKSSTGLTNASFRVHLYRGTSPTVTNGDNGAWLSNGVATYLGSMDVTMDRAFTDGAAGHGVPVNGSDINIDGGSRVGIYALIEARAAYTPVAQEVFTLTLEDIEELG